MPSARHILIVNSRSVHQPVFVVGAPHAGADLIGRALKASPGFHVTMGQPSVLRVVYAFARRPSMYQGRTQAAAAVMRDAFAQGWQVTPHSCLECTRECRAAAGLAADAVGPCVELRGLERFGDASPDLIYCAEALTYAFPDARIVQVIRDGRDVVMSMLADPVVMSWFRPSFVNVDTEFPNPFFGIETEDERELWPKLSPAARCALRWRWSVRLAARLHHSLPAGQLKTVRYEDLLSKPDESLADLSRFAGTAVSAAEIRDVARTSRQRGRSRRPAGPSLIQEDVSQIDKLAGEELRRLGYSLLADPQRRPQGRSPRSTTDRASRPSGVEPRGRPMLTPRRAANSTAYIRMTASDSAGSSALISPRSPAPGVRRRRRGVRLAGLDG